ncbi:hypothetical protein PAHAL_9G423400 [Panicum hallii]|uniref:Uncharacterized protein n=1 Tax=Panicum hallii TaxID=206008 RepID=A0A2T8I4G6_9POAL|nr:hypothetical protein PAHAL_9G423400 [Panicum hallii]
MARRTTVPRCRSPSPIVEQAAKQPPPARHHQFSRFILRLEFGPRQWPPSPTKHAAATTSSGMHLCCALYA